MTAPIVTEAPQSTPVTQEGRFGVDDAIASITNDAVAQTIAENTPAEESQTARDEKGRFAKAEETPAVEGQPVPEITPAESAQPVEEEAPVELPEGMVAVPKIERELAMPFKVMDSEGEIDVPDLMLEFTANGKTRKEPLDKVVKLASMGVYNHERELQVQAAKADVQQTQSQLQQVIQYAQQLEAEREALLSSDDIYLTKRAQYEQQNTPEAKLAAAQQQMQQHEARQGFTQAANQGQQFFASELEPAVMAITKALPTIGVEEIGAKLLLVSDRYKVHTPFGSIIDPRAYDAIRQAIVQEVVPWAQQVHEHRETDRSSSTAKLTAEKQAALKAAETAQVSAQKAKTLVTKVAKPGTGRASKDTPPPKPLKSVEDFEQSAIEATMAAMGMSKAS